MKYTVLTKSTENFAVTVEASSDADAVAQALGMIDSDPERYWTGSKSEIEAILQEDYKQNATH